MKGKHPFLFCFSNNNLFFMVSKPKGNVEKINLRFVYSVDKVFIQRVSEIGALVLAGGGAHQGEQLFSLPFWRETLRNGLKK
jgi:hypothetical protein